MSDSFNCTWTFILVFISVQIFNMMRSSDDSDLLKHLSYTYSQPAIATKLSHNLNNISRNEHSRSDSLIIANISKYHFLGLSYFIIVQFSWKKRREALPKQIVYSKIANFLFPIQLQYFFPLRINL